MSRPDRCFRSIPRFTRRRFLQTAGALAASCSLRPLRSVSGEEADKKPVPFEFFAFDNGTGRGTIPLAEQARMLADLGYDGIGYTGTADIPEMLHELESRGLKMYSTYVNADLRNEEPQFSPGLREAIGQLKGHGTALWLTLTGRPGDGRSDDRAAAAVNQVADWAAAAELPVVLYPHVGMYVASIDDGLRVANRVDRPNVGTSFNLCHWLKLDKPENMEAAIQRLMPRLKLVSINGADFEGNWDRLIQTLDRGQFDNLALLKTLRRFGYTGPIGLQCYAIPGDCRENLTRSIEAWHRLTAQLAAE